LGIKAGIISLKKETETMHHEHYQTFLSDEDSGTKDTKD